MIAFIRESWKLGDYSPSIISRLRQLAAARAYFKLFRSFIGNIAKKINIFFQNVYALNIDNMKTLKYFNISTL